MLFIIRPLHFISHQPQLHLVFNENVSLLTPSAISDVRIVVGSLLAC